MNMKYINNILTERVYREILRYRKRIYINNISLNSLNDVMNNVLDSYPDIFYVQEWNCYMYGSDVYISPEYIYKKNIIVDMRIKCEEQADIICSRLVGMNNIQMAKRLHDILVRNITYDNDDSYEVHTIAGALLNRRAVCDGYSKLYKYILDKMGVDCIIVRGKGFNGLLVNSEEHAWNMVKIGQDWFHVDVTYDATLSLTDFIRYDYFLTDEKTTQIDHYYNLNAVPRAYKNSMSSSYVKKIINKYDLNIYIRDCLINKKNDFVVALPMSIEKGDIEGFVNQAIKEEIEKLCRSATWQTYANIERRIVHIRVR